MCPSASDLAGAVWAEATGSRLEPTAPSGTGVVAPFRARARTPSFPRWLPLARRAHRTRVIRISDAHTHTYTLQNTAKHTSTAHSTCRYSHGRTRTHTCRVLCERPSRAHCTLNHCTHHTHAWVKHIPCQLPHYSDRTCSANLQSTHRRRLFHTSSPSPLNSTDTVL